MYQTRTMSIQSASTPTTLLQQQQSFIDMRNRSLIVEDSALDLINAPEGETSLTTSIDRKQQETYYRSPGEAMVYRDMVDLCRRETELRRYWSAMGFQLPFNNDCDFKTDGDASLRHQTVPTENDIHLDAHGDRAQRGIVNTSADDRRNRNIKNELSEMNVVGVAHGSTKAGKQRDFNGYNAGRRASAAERQNAGRRHSLGSPETVPDCGKQPHYIYGLDGQPSTTAAARARPARSVGRPSRADAERRIENEVAEAKQREAELRYIVVVFQVLF
jgi:hypothetical protein